MLSETTHPIIMVVLLFNIERLPRGADFMLNFNFIR